MNHPAPLVVAAEVVLPCRELEPTLRFFTERLPFRLHSIHPADRPRVAVLVGAGLRLRLELGAGEAGTLRLVCAGREAPERLVAPNGTTVELVPERRALELLPLAPALSVRRAEEGDWTVGRAGMLYRDLLPDRQGGRFGASHIRIPGGGPVPDYVHHHHVRFQWIHCLAGWVRVVYEDQGPPFELRAGEGVLQPPGIRHRVLACSDALEVLEVSSPAEHETFADPDRALPSAGPPAARDYAGQRFVRYDAVSGTAGPWRASGFAARELGIARATGGLAAVSDVRPAAGVVAAAGGPVSHRGELAFAFLVAGRVDLELPGRGIERLQAGCAVAVPPGLPHTWKDPSGDLELLELTLPAPA